MIERPTTVLRKLLATKELIVAPWPAIRDSVAIKESRAFGQRLQSLGQQWQCPTLAGYGQKLLHEVALLWLSGPEIGK